MNEYLDFSASGVTLSAEYKRRTLEAIIETQKLLNAELKYSEQFQKKDVIERYQQHIEKLVKILEKY